MEESTNYVRRTQKDYTMTFKLNVVREAESGTLSLSEAKLKYGSIQGDSTVKKWLGKSNTLTYAKVARTKDHGVGSPGKTLQKQNTQLERQNYVADQKAIIFDMMIDIAEQEYKIDIRKNYPSEPSVSTQQKKKKA